MGACKTLRTMQNQATTAARKNAVTLRAAMTDGERRLWARLRREQLGVKFRRQHPLGGYVRDFVCLERKLVIEVDGSQHLEQVAYDARRSAWLESRGFQVLRFWANEALSETGAVVERIIHTLGLVAPLAPTPTLPQRGRESTQGNTP